MVAFIGEKAFLSNMHPCELSIIYNGVVYNFHCSEAAYQAMKCPERIDEFTELNGPKSKALGRKVELRSDWSSVLIDVMRYVINCKFRQNPELAERLMAVEGEIVEYNEWKDTFWGVYEGVGENHLGRLLMELRNDLVNGKTQFCPTHLGLDLYRKEKENA